MVSKSDNYISATAHVWSPPDSLQVALLKVKEARRHAMSGWPLKWDHWALDYFYQPMVQIRVGKETSPILDRPPRTAHLYPPHTQYWEFSPIERGTIHSGWIFFRGGEALGLESLLKGRGSSRYARFDDPQRVLGGKMQELAVYAATYGHEGFFRAQGMLYDIVDLLKRSTPGTDGNRVVAVADPSPQQDPLVVAARRYMQEHLADACPMGDLARQLGVSLSTLYHRYKKATGEGPKRSILRMRLELAREMIVHGERVKTAAYHTGFHDEQHFSKVFKKILGIPPGRCAS